MNVFSMLYGKVRGVPSDTVLGRTTDGTGKAEALSAMQLGALLALGTAAYAATGDFDAVGTASAAVAGEAATRSAADVALSSAIDGKADLSHTHPSTAISDGTAAGRALFTAADAAAQLALLGITPTAPGGSSGQLQYNNAGAFGGAAGLAWSATSPNLTVTAQGSTHVPLCIVGAASQSAHLQDWKDSGGTALSYADISSSSGRIVTSKFAFIDNAPFRYITSQVWNSDLRIDVITSSNKIGFATGGGGSGDTWLFTNGNVLAAELSGLVNKTYTVRGFDQDTVAGRGTCSLTVRGGNSHANAGSLSGSSIVGGALNLAGGNGSSGASGAAHGGDISMTPGTGYGTGRQGLVLIYNLPTSDPGVTGALWNSAGTLKVS